LDFALSEFHKLNIARAAVNERTFAVLSRQGSCLDFRDNALIGRVFIRSGLGLAVIKKALHDFPDY
jgi:hypothetical protein